MLLMKWGATLALLAAFVVPAAFAQTGTYNPDTPADPATEARLRELSQELRCLVCQNQNIADSNADLAVDLRREVRSQILQGKSDAAIKSYLVARYGDFVLYRPPMQSNTALLWFGPLALLVVGITVWWMLSRRRAAMVPPFGVSVEDVSEPAVRGSSTNRNAAFRLLELVAVLWILEEVGEIREQVEAVPQNVGAGANRSVPV